MQHTQEQTLAQLERDGVFNQLFASWTDAVIVVDDQGCIRASNPRCTLMFGYANTALLGKPVEMLMPQRFHQGHTQHRESYIARAHARPMGTELALWATRSDGSEFPVEIGLTPIKTAQGLWVCANIRDITQTERATTLRQRAAQAEAVASFGQRSLTTPDLATTKREACDVMQRFLNVDVTLLVESTDPTRPLRLAAGAGCPTAMIGETLPEEAKGDLYHFALQLSEPVIIEDFRRETRFDTPLLDSLGIVSGVSCQVPGREGPLGVIGAYSRQPRTFSREDANFIQGIANTLGAAFERQHIAERLGHSQKLEALGQLTGGVAHDFNNLLTIITGNLQLLEDHGNADAFQTKAIANATRAVRRGADLTRKLLAFAQRQTLQPRAIDLSVIIPAVAEMLRRTLGERVDVAVLIAPDTPAVRADPASLETAVMNLAINARDAMPNGGLITVEVRRETLDATYALREPDVTPGDYVLLAVTDTGTGMQREVMSHVFEPFFTTKEKGKGSGLGLAMVYGFAKQSGGHVKIYSEVGAGTSVKLYLPLADAAERPATLGRMREIQGGHESILVVEDDTEVREIAVQFASGLGYRVLEARDAVSALAILEGEDKIDLLFTDIVLGSGQTGLELAQRAQSLRPELKVLYTSGYARGALLTRHPEPGIELLNKPYRREQLAEKLRTVLDGRYSS